MAKKRRRGIKRIPHDLDIVIPVYGRPDLLQKCLDSIAKQEANARLILVDDQGPDQDKLDQVYRSLNSTSELLRNKDNRGFAATVNRGATLGKSPLILILNTDVELWPGAIAAMVAEFDDLQVGVVGAKLLFPPDSTDPTRPAGKVQHTGLAINFQGQIVHPNIAWSADHPRVNERRVCQAVTGACLMTRRSVWKQVISFYRQSGDKTSGAFNELYGAGTYEDVEYCFAARSGGHQVIYTPEATAYHHVGASVMQNGGGYPLQRNEMIFKARCGGLLAWDEWRFL